MSSSRVSLGGRYKRAMEVGENSEGWQGTALGDEGIGRGLNCFPIRRDWRLIIEFRRNHVVSLEFFDL